LNYREYNDNELLTYIYESNEEANEILFEKYKPLIFKCARKLFNNCQNSGLELNDLIQEGMLGLSNAINNYNENKDIIFYTFAKTCIERKIISAVVASKRLKHKILNDSVSIEVEMDENNVLNLDYLFVDDEHNPETIVFDIEEQKNLILSITQKLTPLENQVFELKLNELNYKEIASLLDMSPKTVDNTIQRIRNKAKKIIDENNK